MSLTQWLTRSRPIVLCVFVSKATLSFVPTPSAEATRTGARIEGNEPSNMPPKLPISESVRALKVARETFLHFPDTVRGFCAGFRRGLDGLQRALFALRVNVELQEQVVAVGVRV